MFVIPDDLPTWHTIRMDARGFDANLVRQKMAEQRVSQTTLAKVAKLTSQSAMSNILLGKRRITADEAAAIYTFLGIRPEPTFLIAPVIGLAAAGNWREAVQIPLGHMPFPIGIAGDSAFGVEVSGDSMDKLIEDGGWVLIDPDRKELRDGSCYLIANSEHETTVKMYRRSPARFEPVSSNPEHKAFLVSDDDFVVIGKVVWKGSPVQ